MDLRDWKAFVAALLAGAVTGLEALVGNPWSPDGRALFLVVVMMLLDFVIGTASAIATRSWKFARLRQGAGKLLLWGAMLVVARQLSRPIGVMGADALLRFVSDYLLVYLILVDLVSVLKHCVTLALLYGVAVPGLDRLIRYVEQWHEQQLLPPADATKDPPQDRGEVNLP